MHKEVFYAQLKLLTNSSTARDRLLDKLFTYNYQLEIG
ncbi:MAG: hypothetical protein OFPII_12600 [Osedax symbiont Rs1]|nr:MAG: hypothetical protein OFPII_12600 [Osedax symbiont Rs1]